MARPVVFDVEPSQQIESKKENDAERCSIVKCIWCIGYKCVASRNFFCKFKEPSELETFESAWKLSLKGEKAR